MRNRNEKGVFVKGHLVPSEWREKLSVANKGRDGGVGWSAGLTKETDSRLARMSIAKTGKPSPKKGRPVSDGQKRKQSLAMTGRKQTEEQRQWRRDHPVNYWKGKTIPKVARLKMSASKKESWKDPSYVKKVMEGRHLSPNKAELKLFKILEKMYPGEWKFTGDFSFTINGKCPDFVNCNGQKKVIEFNGTYWHQNDVPGEREGIFAEFGYDTLIIWDTEMKNLDNVKNRIRTFHERNKR